MLRRTVSTLTVAPFFGQVSVPPISNEPMNNFEPGSESRKKLQAAVDKLLKAGTQDVPCIVHGKEYRPGKILKREIPSNRQQILANYYNADEELVKKAVESALEARKEWSRTPLQTRLAVVLKAANMISTSHRYEFQAATMIGQSKNPWQAEIDSVAESIDFFRFNAQYAQDMAATQPRSPAAANVWNALDYRPLEGFVLAISPFNFTAIGANLAMGPAMMGNTVVWKPSPNAVYANYLTMKIFEEAGLPPGVINFIPATPEAITAQATMHQDLAGVAFTGSTKVFTQISKQVASNLENYRSYPRVSGETGGKNFHLVHPTADMKSVAATTLRSAFEYQGQKCSACSRAFVPKSRWAELKDLLLERHANLKQGGPECFENFMCAVIDEAAFEKNMKYINIAKSESCCTVLAGGEGSKEKGYFVKPTIIETTDPMATTMREEIFGPVLTIYVYDDAKAWESEVFKLIDESTLYGLTGSIYARDRDFLTRASDALRNAAGNLYLNDKSTGAVVGQQPFGGARGSGTNDKAGSPSFLNRWVSPRTIKESFDTNYAVSYPHQLPDSF